jgi:hypothetical protein
MRSLSAFICVHLRPKIEVSMIHARDDYNRIQDPAGLIPQDEPVFLLRAQDVAAPQIVAAWADAIERLGGSPELVAAAREALAACNRANSGKWPIEQLRTAHGLPPASQPAAIAAAPTPEPALKPLQPQFQESLF